MPRRTLEASRAIRPAIDTHPLHLGQVVERADVVSLRPKIRRDRARLERIVALVNGGAVRVPEIKVYPLSEAAAAHKVSEGRHRRGKFVFKVS
jgi:NADPH:quinone reductase-like Zn-dependent oxidoreductase